MKLGTAVALLSLALVLLASGAAQARPNVVVVMTDDQALSQMRALDKTRRQIGRRGVTFTRSYAAQPQCCPNRATFLTGQYPHNHGVRTNQPPKGGYTKLNHRNTLPVWLNRAGYRTAFIGKYMNGYTKVRDIPPGWDEWAALMNRFAYNDFTLRVNGGKERHAGYQTDVFARRAADFIDRSSGRRPFFLWVAPVAPHVIGNRKSIGEPGNPPAAPRHEDAFSKAKAPRTRSFDERDVSDKPGFIRKKPRLSGRQKRKIDRHYRSTLAALLSVDDLVAKVRRRLAKNNELDDTLVVFTSDNGYFFGEHRNFCCKDQVYEEAARVPLMMRGPGLPRGVRRRQLVSSIDLAPTILDLAGADARRRVDGVSLLPLARSRSARRGRDLLIETFTNKFFAVRSGKWKYSRQAGSGQEELYDIGRDPLELRSRHRDAGLRRVESSLAARLRELKRCAGASCR